MTNNADREMLAHWCECSSEQLQLVFLPARRAGHVTLSQVLLAQDLISICLVGTSGTLGAGRKLPRYTAASFHHLVTLHHIPLLPHSMLPRYTAPHFISASFHCRLIPLLPQGIQTQATGHRPCLLFLSILSSTSRN